MMNSWNLLRPLLILLPGYFLAPVAYSQTPPDTATIVRQANGGKDREDWPENPISASYFMGPSAYGPGKGKGYYQTISGVIHQGNVGLTDNISLGVGTVPILLVEGALPYWLIPKVSIPVVENVFSLGCGAGLGVNLGEGQFLYDTDNRFFSIPFAVGTLGNPDRNASIGLGYMLTEVYPRKPLISLGGMYRISRKTYLVTDNHYIPGEILFNMVGARIVWSRVALDIGAFLQAEPDYGITNILPLLNLSAPFREKKNRTDR